LPGPIPPPDLTLHRNVVAENCLTEATEAGLGTRQRSQLYI